MKLKLLAEKDVQILVATEAITVRDAQVLQSGINKLLKNGKNLILVDLGSVQEQDLPPEVLMNLAHLDLVARELSGRVVLGGVSAQLRQKIEHHAKPPVILCFEEREKAIAFLRDPEGAEAAHAAPQAQAALSEAQLAEILQKKDKVRQRELQELGPIRKQLAQAEEENRFLRKQLEAAVHDHRRPVDAKAQEEKIRALETELNRLLEEIRQQKPSGPGKP